MIVDGYLGSMGIGSATRARQSRTVLEVSLLSDAERCEYQVEDVVGGGGSGDGIEGPQGIVEIEQQHFVGDFGGHGAGSEIERESSTRP
jgi:hypothetical protein